MIKFRKNISVQEVRSILVYDSDTGIFTWRWRHDCPKNWNNRRANTIAGTLHVSGYRTITINKISYLAHRLAWLYMTGEWPFDVIDHIDLNKANNRWKNLRPSSSQGNVCNRGKQRNNRSGYKGVYWERVAQKWRAIIRINRQKICLGCFTDILEAASAYEIAAKKYHGEFARIE